MRKNKIIFLSNANGGIASFQNNLIQFFINNKVSISLIDQANNLSTNNRNLVYFYKCKIVNNYFKCIKILFKIGKENRLDQSIFIISNPSVFAAYFIFIKLFFKNSKIFFFLHSHLLNINLFQIISAFLSSLFSILAHKIVFVSNFTKSWWNLYYPLTRITENKVLYNKIIKPKRFYRKNYDRLSIGFVGRFEKEKGLEKFLRITNKIKDKKFIYYVFGNGSHKINKKKYKNVKFFNWSKKETIYTKINVLFVSSEIENCPLNVLEAKSYGIPTITLSKGGINEIITNNIDGILLKRDISDKILKKKMNYLLKKYKTFEKNCFKISKKYEIERYKIKFFL